MASFYSKMRRISCKPLSFLNITYYYFFAAYRSGTASSSEEDATGPMITNKRSHLPEKSNLREDLSRGSGVLEVLQYSAGRSRLGPKAICEDAAYETDFRPCRHML